MNANEPEINAIGTATLLVTASDLASALAAEPQEAFPTVLATARMVALMEIASARILQPCLGAGELSVGVSLEVTHTAPTPEGATATATSRFVGRDGKLFVFEVGAVDEGGEIGKGRHKRAIINVERLQNNATRRIMESRNSVGASAVS